MFRMVFMGVFGGGAALAAVAGVIAAPFLSIYLGMGNDVLLDCFVVIVVGGFGSLFGAFIASLMIGELQSFGILWIPRLGPCFSISAHGRCSDYSTYRPFRRKRMNRLGPDNWYGEFDLLFYFCFPFFLSEITNPHLDEVLIYALFAIGFNLLFGYAGLLPFGMRRSSASGLMPRL